MQKKKSGVKKCLEILPLRGGVGRLMANAILNFHFDFPGTSLNPNQEMAPDLPLSRFEIVKYKSRAFWAPAS